MKLFNFKNINKFKIKDYNNPLEDPYFEISNIIKENRAKRNLSMDELSNISRIPISTIHGLENNKKELIPQYPFTRSILLKIEECLFIEKFKLTKLAKKDIVPIEKKNKNKLVLNNINIFNFWQGTTVYLLILLISIFILNKYYINTKVIEFKYIEKSIN